MIQKYSDCIVIRLVEAIRHFRKIRGAKDNDRLGHVFDTMAAMGSKRYDKTRDKYLADPQYVELVRSSPSLSEQIADLDSLQQMDEGSFGRAMYDYLTSSGFNHGKFQAAYQTTGLQSGEHELLRAYDCRERDLHDIIHVLFGYGRTRFGEVATISTHYWQGGASGYGAISFIGVTRYAFTRPRVARLLLKALRSVWDRQKDIELRSYPFEYSLNKPLNLIQQNLNIPPKNRLLCAVLEDTGWN